MGCILPADEGWDPVLVGVVSAGVVGSIDLLEEDRLGLELELALDLDLDLELGLVLGLGEEVRSNGLKRVNKLLFVVVDVDDREELDRFLIVIFIWVTGVIGVAGMA